MTNLQALKSLIAFPVDSGVLEKALIDQSLIAADEYSVATKGTVDKAAIQVLRHVQQLSSFSEGDLSFSVNAAAIEQAIADLKGDNPAGRQPYINDATSLW